MRTARDTSAAEHPGWCRLLCKLVLPETLSLPGNHAFGQAACPSYGWASHGKIFPLRMPHVMTVTHPEFSR